MAAVPKHQSISQQIEVLIGRGLVVTEQDKTALMRLLIDNGYYRLAGYWRYR
jgi:abortive infection bacteriophage resistance protein